MNTNKSNKALLCVGQLLICIAFLFPIPLGLFFNLLFPGLKYDALDPTDDNVAVSIISLIFFLVGIICCIYSVHSSRIKNTIDNTILSIIKKIGYITWGIIISLCVVVGVIIGIYYIFRTAPAASMFFIGLAAILIFLIRFGLDIFNRK